MTKKDAISRQAMFDILIKYNLHESRIAEELEELPPVTGHCKDCKWWKDSDGVYRRGIGAESQCPINDGIVYEGNGYCYRFKPQESEK